jgi:enoyl-CoA hydratase/carnithine racemase
MQLETMYSITDGSVATVVLNRPHVLNCANEQWAQDLNTVVDNLAAAPALRVVVVRGSGRAFCTGIDLTALSLGEIGMTFYRNWEAALRKLEMLDAVSSRPCNRTASAAGSSWRWPAICAWRATMRGSG